MILRHRVSFRQRLKDNENCFEADTASAVSLLIRLSQISTDRRSNRYFSSAPLGGKQDDGKAYAFNWTQVYTLQLALSRLQCPNCGENHLEILFDVPGSQIPVFVPQIPYGRQPC
jgi:hypothetical protein